MLAPASRAPVRPSIVLVSLDTLRASSMSAYGYALPTTPEFQRIAAEGVLFENAFTTFSNTLAAHMSMLTGLYPATHGVPRSGPLSAAHPTLAESLRGAGYETAAITENGLITARMGFARGFAHYVEDKTSAWHAVGPGAPSGGRSPGRERTPTTVLPVRPHLCGARTLRARTAYRKIFTSSRLRAAIASYEREVRELDDELGRLVAELDGCSDAIATSSSSPPTTARSSTSTGARPTSSSTTR